MATEALLSIGVYGFAEEAFFKTMIDAGIDCFCDVRARRGLRGSEYAFANSQRLQARLSVLSIAYIHAKNLSPSATVRSAQRDADAQQHIAKRSRTELGLVFRNGYTEECLHDLDAEHLLGDILHQPRHPVFFCVEREPAACHRSLLVEELARQTGLPVRHLTP